MQTKLRTSKGSNAGFDASGTHGNQSQTNQREFSKEVSKTLYIEL
jgi:hypothetical protein